jgi:DNA-binding SARP family transcriptional activator
MVGGSAYMVIVKDTGQFAGVLAVIDRMESPTAAVRLLANQVAVEHRALAAAIEHLSVTLDSLLEAGAAHLWSDQTEACAIPAEPPLAVYCLGSFRLMLDGRPVQNWRAGKARALFQYLVSHRTRPAAREAIMEALWPDSDQLPAGTTLKVVVHRLRKALSRTTDELDVQAAEDGYRLEAPNLWVDVEEFERLCALGRRQESLGQGVAASASYAQAVDLYGGDFLEEVFDEWVILRRERLKDQYLRALARLTDAAYANADYESCIERCQQILAHDQCREQAYRFLMLCYAHLGQRGRVQRWYEVCVQTLRTELDVDPEQDTANVYRNAMAGDFGTASELAGSNQLVTPP